jgi:hypothetical protein
MGMVASAAGSSGPMLVLMLERILSSASVGFQPPDMEDGTVWVEAVVSADFAALARVDTGGGRELAFAA